MLKWLTEYVSFLLIDPNKMAEILAALIIFQGINFIFMAILVLRISVMETSLKRAMGEAERKNG